MLNLLVLINNLFLLNRSEVKMQIIKARLRVGKRSFLEVGVVSFYFTRWGGARALIIQPGGRMRTVKANRLVMNTEIPDGLSHVVRPAGSVDSKSSVDKPDKWFDSRGRGFKPFGPFKGRS